MARIRTLKPTFWTDSKVVQLSPMARLLFIGMWSFALCDQGHLQDDPVQLRLKIFPADQVDIEPLVRELASVGVVRRESARDGETACLSIPKFAEHQKLDPRWVTKCPFCQRKQSPAPPPHSPDPADTHPDSPELAESHPKTSKDGVGWDGTKSKPSVEPEPATLTLVPAVVAAVVRPKPPAEDPLFVEFWSAYPRKVAKGAARKSWKAAVKKTGDPDRIIVAAQGYGEDSAGKSAEYVKHPATWLNSECYDDEPPRSYRPASETREIPARWNA